ncbi:sel1 repeat family protein [Pseudomonas sp. PDM10]|uniref:tetratricopeptide repeat protein n=1 Tax=Pseudomonas sp. PDM10 TaxID=2769269 RepID=UPI00178748E4|nr:sel1 repeat family protein [Pseudomonas sp. PDM10]MBD9600199.1 sel1 repeat family protein [Pseudomonas sp. PDM10]
MRKLIIGALFALALSGYANAHLTQDEQSAKSRGILLFNQYKNAQFELRIAAEAGDTEAQFYLAEELRKEKQFMTAEAKKWYEASAAQGDYYSMFQLATAGGDLCAVANKCPSGIKSAGDWLELLIKTAEPRAMKGDAEAMAIMYNAKSDLTWLEKSAEAGYAPAQWLLANRYSEGEGSLLLPWNRKSAEEKWLKESSEGGYPKAMIEYISILYQRGDMEGVRHWLEIAAKTGYQDAVSSYGAYLSHTPDKVGYPIDLIKGYALVSLLKELDGGGNVQIYVEGKLPLISEKMTPEQITEANRFAKEWKATHPPLSFYPEKLGL